MRGNDQRGLWELVNCADIAIRAASALRQMKSGHAMPDPSAVEDAISFLRRARQGGAFMSGKLSQLGDSTLKPLNWATDTYVQTSTNDPYAQPDYDRVDEYLERITGALDDTRQPGVSYNLKLDEALVFFEKLAEIVGGRADFVLMGESGANRRL